MKKYFIKISALFILAVIFFTANSFCFHSLFGPMFDIPEAKAAPVVINDNCEAHQAEAKETKTSNQNSLLPCCSSDTHPTLISSVWQIPAMAKNIPIVFFNEHETVKAILISSVYHEPLTSPPELLAIRTTILRI